jgi:hypothetical protein
MDTLERLLTISLVPGGVDPETRDIWRWGGTILGRPEVFDPGLMSERSGERGASPGKESCMRLASIGGVGVRLFEPVVLVALLLLSHFEALLALHATLPWICPQEIDAEHLGEAEVVLDCRITPTEFGLPPARAPQNSKLSAWDFEMILIECDPHASV